MRIYYVKSTNTPEERAEIEAKKLDSENYPELVEYWDNFVKLSNDKNSYDINDVESLFFLSDKMLSKFLMLLLNVGYKVEIQEVTKDLFYNNFDLSKAPAKFLKSVTKYLSSQFGGDDVLDKMLEVKNYTLTEADINILKSV